MSFQVPAVVVGLCSHGLAVVRALGRAGVKVYALEARGWVPGTRTRWAEVVPVPDINGPGLLDALDQVLPEAGSTEAPVLFLTSDDMVRVVAEGWEKIEGRCRLSWAHSRQAILRFLDKRSLEEQCKEAGLSYPRTAVVQGLEEIRDHLVQLTSPLIVKPARPLSSFKAKVCQTAEAVEGLARRFSADLPFLAQEYVEGGDRMLRFGALYLENGNVLAQFEGRKLRSFPPNGGGTSAAEPCPDNGLFLDATRFFSGLSLSGPVSLEMKVDPHGDRWVIEPTVGRTDYWLDCCVANGVNLPVIEYCHQAGLRPVVGRRCRSSVWFDSERDKLALFSLLGKSRETGWNIRFSYWAGDDPAPFFRGCLLYGLDLAARLFRRMRRLFVCTVTASGE